MYDHQHSTDARDMEKEIHKAHVQETASRCVVGYATAFMWVSIGISVLVAAISYAI